MRSKIIIIVIIIASLIQCDQSPTTLDEEPYLRDSGETTFSMEISRFEFDYLSQQFFFSVEVTSPIEIAEVVYNLGLNSSAYFLLNDLGQGEDILIGDGRYDGGWTLPDTLSTYVDSLWTLEVIVRDEASNSLAEFKTLQPERPAPPVIGAASHLDTLTLLSNGLVLDTLTLEVSHPAGLDEIRDVSMMSLKPDGSYANQGQPIPLYDDGGSVIFYSFGGIDFTSGDSLANDGVYSLLLALDPTNLSGIYHWTFNSRSWLGIEAIPVIDSIVVLPAGSLSRGQSKEFEQSGVFK
ncbi:MAG: hypothetical protein HN995_13930 [Candidatus Marinimicrobia bacterium]|jgi:hypothetical protein|nr:hypothetical protein [Candidatus Neomarinimicrobiota bacterium]MBT3575565.1 hypothetical protein [Candidatus Neomarinimicrobiota bacterium]MBT3679662.1 hypothetical protein [Candidatus Neomarinimicrobiota bacterium]MBT3950619.1 hypothetical protein [Candidatus Neomarinimicrobiota bacterium]MBT4253394.1 hypothetical protein [Candidatus Neomarinimicrobiota bacterium]